MLISNGYGSLCSLHVCYSLQVVNTKDEDFLASLGIWTVFWYLLLMSLWFSQEIPLFDISLISKWCLFAFSWENQQFSWTIMPGMWLSHTSTLHNSTTKASKTVNFSVFYLSVLRLIPNLYLLFYQKGHNFPNENIQFYQSGSLVRIWFILKR